MTDPEAAADTTTDVNDEPADQEEEDEPLDDLELEVPEADAAEQHRVVPVDEDEYR